MAKNNNLQDFITDIADVIRGIKGGDGLINPQNFSPEISDIKDIMSPTHLPTETKRLYLKSGYVDVPTSPYIKIVDKNFKSWSIEEWHEEAEKRSFTPTTDTAAPIGFEIFAWGVHFVYYMKSKYTDTAGLSKTYYDITGSTAITNGGLRHSAWQHTMNIFANGEDSQGKPIERTFNGVTAKSTRNGDTVELSTSNSPFKWPIKYGLTFANAFDPNDAKEQYNALKAYTEFYRIWAAKDLGVITTQQISDWKLLNDDGSAKLVDISVLNATGTERALKNEDMYFWIYDHSTSSYVNLNTLSPGLLAKYNPTGTAASAGIFGGENLTEDISNSIYLKQVENGVNMNDNAENIVGVENGKIILTEGGKGAQVYCYDVTVNNVTEKHLFLVTPIISRANNGTTQLVSPDYNIPDSPAISWITWYNSQFSEPNTPEMFMPNERMLQAIRCNRPTCLNKLRAYLNHAQGEAWGLPDFPAEYVWSSSRYNANFSWYVSLGSGGMSYNGVYSRYVAAAVSACPHGIESGGR